jgi:hypothetical protein
MWEWTYNSTILYLGTSWRLIVSFTPRPLYPRYLLARRLGGLQSRIGRCGLQINFPPLPGIEPRPYSP